MFGDFWALELENVIILGKHCRIDGRLKEAETVKCIER
jgi:hypothetical protein